MDTTSAMIVAPKENGESQLLEKDNLVSTEEGAAADGGECVSVSGDLLKPALQQPEDENADKILEAKDDKAPILGEFASDEVIAESTVVASVNGDRVTLVHDEISTDGAIISTETEVTAPEILELPGSLDLRCISVEPDVADDVAAESDSYTNEEPAVGNTTNAPDEVTEETAESASRYSEQSDAEVGKPGRKRNQRKESLQSDESGGKEPGKGRFAIQANLNVNSRPKRSVPRRSVFEMLQGEIRSTGHSKRLSTDTGSESDLEPGPSRRANSRRSRVSNNEQSAKSGVRRDPQMKRRNREKDEETSNKDSDRPYKKKSLRCPCGTESSEQADAFVDDHSALDFDLTTNLDDEDDDLTLASFRKEKMWHSSNNEPSDKQNAVDDDSAADVGIDGESNFEGLEYNSRWHSYASPRRLESPLSDQEVKQPAKDQGYDHHSRVLTATSIKKNDKNSQKHQDIQQFETHVNEDKEKSGTPWYLAAGTSNETLNDPKILQSRIDELLKVNAELRSRMKEAESKSSTKKFNIDFHSRKFSKAREPVFGSPADRKSTISLGKTGAGTSADRGLGTSSFTRDLKEKELALDRREEKIRNLGMELNERSTQLKASEGKLLRLERRLKEMEKTLEYKERVLKRMETNADRKESDGKGDNIPSDQPDQSTGCAAETDRTKLERKEQELERFRRFLSEEREKLLPKQQRLTKWEAVLRKKEDGIRVREQRLLPTSVSRKRRMSRSDSESDDSDDVGKPLKALNARTSASVRRKHLSMEKRKETSTYKACKEPTRATPSSVNKSKTVVSNKVHSQVKKRSSDGTPLKEYKLRKRC